MLGNIWLGIVNSSLIALTPPLKFKFWFNIRTIIYLWMKLKQKHMLMYKLVVGNFRFRYAFRFRFRLSLFNLLFSVLVSVQTDRNFGTFGFSFKFRFRSLTIIDFLYLRTIKKKFHEKNSKAALCCVTFFQFETKNALNYTYSMGQLEKAQQSKLALICLNIRLYL